ncbi:hypothetical protein [Marinobacter qingdaonensis]|uniref:GT-D fold-like domain-containing protein n=1 Tax=Marinobacter qingdaonensis TaxID=3108486 RepID=A0ABU5P074_9GAMM|nr:hypothetical protein [Marinobacter sp. ASW11-75]MEA1081453.1 hypothetical protein [Marinobacter sp. ASW11-75]
MNRGSPLRQAKIALKKAIVNAVIRFLPGLVRNVVARSKAAQDDVRILTHAITFSRDPVLSLNFYSGDGCFAKSVIWRSLVKLEETEPRVFGLLIENRSSVHSDELRLKLELKHVLRNESILTKESFDGLLLPYLKLVRLAEEPKGLASMFATVVIARAPVERIEETLGQLGTDTLQLTEFQKVKFLSRLANNGFHDSFISWSKELNSGMTQAGKLKVSLMRAHLFGRDSDSFRVLEEQFANLGFDISRQYTQGVRPLYDRIPVDKNYLAAKFDRERLDSLRDFILDSVAAGNALSYIRVGDGECYGMADDALVDEKGITRQEIHWWGEQLEDHQRLELQAQFKSSLESADILGVPTVLRLIKDFNLAKTDSYPPNSLISRILCVMQGVGPYLENRMVVEDQSNLYLFNREFVNDLFNNAKKVCVISGVNSKLVSELAPSNKNLTTIEIPTHRLLRDKDVGSSIEGILPHVYKRYLDEISALSEPGVVFLISAGFIGKIFIAEAAKRGAVALDVGQSLVNSVSAEGYAV